MHSGISVSLWILVCPYVDMDKYTSIEVAKLKDLRGRMCLHFGAVQYHLWTDLVPFWHADAHICPPYSVNFSS